MSSSIGSSRSQTPLPFSGVIAARDDLLAEGVPLALIPELPVYITAGRDYEQSKVWEKKREGWHACGKQPDLKRYDKASRELQNLNNQWWFTKLYGGKEREQKLQMLQRTISGLQSRKDELEANRAKLRFEWLDNLHKHEKAEKALSDDYMSGYKIDHVQKRDIENRANLLNSSKIISKKIDIFERKKSKELLGMVFPLDITSTSAAQLTSCILLNPLRFQALLRKDFFNPLAWDQSEPSLQALAFHVPQRHDEIILGRGRFSPAGTTHRNVVTEYGAGLAFVGSTDRDAIIKAACSIADTQRLPKSIADRYEYVSPVLDPFDYLTISPSFFTEDANERLSNLHTKVNRDRLQSEIIRDLAANFGVMTADQQRLVIKTAKKLSDTDADFCLNIPSPHHGYVIKGTPRQLAFLAIKECEKDLQPDVRQEWVAEPNLEHFEYRTDVSGDFGYGDGDRTAKDYYELLWKEQHGAQPLTEDASR